MKRRGGGGDASQPTPRSTIATADVDDRQSAAAAQRAANKASAEAAGVMAASGSAAQPLPMGMIIGGVGLVALMLYLTIKFSAP